jgi:hypothetical protein
MTAGQGVELSHAAAMPAPQGGALPTGLEWQALERMAGMLADSSLIPYKLRGKPGDVAVVLLAAREYGVPPLMALSKLPVVNGTPAPMGELMVALVLRAGHRITVDLHNADGTPFNGNLEPGVYAACTTRRAGDEADNVLTFSLAEAITAGLVEWVNGKPRSRDNKGQALPWELYTGNMLRWRAVANACRLRFPDVLLGLSYLPEELGAVVDETGAPIDMGVAERAQPATGPSSTLEERTAVEWLDKLAERPWDDATLANVLAQAEAGGFADTEVLRENGRTTVRQGIEAHRQARANVVAGTVTPPASTEPPAAERVTEPAETVTPEHHNGTGTDGNGATDHGPHEEPATAPPAAQEPESGHEPAEQLPEPQAPGLTAEDLAIVGLEEGAGGDTSALRMAWEDAKRLELVTVDVAPHLTAEDRQRLSVPADLAVVPLGMLLFEAVRYVKASGHSVRAVIEVEPPDPADPEDPWASPMGEDMSAHL